MHLGRTVPFYVASALAFCYAIFYATFYAARLGRTESGWRGGLEEAEREINEQNVFQALQASRV